jgi:hypothetical protein
MFCTEYSGIVLAGPPEDLFDADEAFDKVFIQLCDLILPPPEANVSPERPPNSDVWASDSTLGFVSDADTGKKYKRTGIYLRILLQLASGGKRRSSANHILHILKQSASRCNTLTTLDNIKSRQIKPIYVRFR